MPSVARWPAFWADLLSLDADGLAAWFFSCLPPIGIQLRLLANISTAWSSLQSGKLQPIGEL